MKNSIRPGNTYLIDGERCKLLYLMPDVPYYTAVLLIISGLNIGDEKTVPIDRLGDPV